MAQDVVKGVKGWVAGESIGSVMAVNGIVKNKLCPKDLVFIGVPFGRPGDPERKIFLDSQFRENRPCSSSRPIFEWLAEFCSVKGVAVRKCG